MKKILFTLLLTFVSLISFSQNNYTSTRTEMYLYNKNTQEWDLYDKNIDTDITVVLEDEFLTIQAKSPTMYKIFKGTAKKITQKLYSGYRYESRDLKTNDLCYIDVFELINGLGYVISVIKNNEYNLRYYIDP